MVCRLQRYAHTDNIRSHTYAQCMSRDNNSIFLYRSQEFPLRSGLINKYFSKYHSDSVVLKVAIS